MSFSLTIATACSDRSRSSVRWALVDQVGDRDPVIRRSDMREMLTGGGHSAWVAAQQRNVEKLGSEIAMAILERAE